MKMQLSAVECEAMELRTPLKIFHFRTWTGPTTVEDTANRLKAVGLVCQKVTIVGTEHVHYTIEATLKVGAELQALEWWRTAGFRVGSNDIHFLKEEPTSDQRKTY